MLALALLAASGAQAQGYRPSGVSFQLESEGISEQLLGGDFSMRSLVVTQNDPSKPALIVLGGRLYLTSSVIDPNGYIGHDPNVGITIGQQVAMAPGAAVLVDNVSPRQSNVPITFGGFFGTRNYPWGADRLGTCGTGGHLQGTEMTLEGTATSRTRTCMCTLNVNTSTYAWALGGGSGPVGTSTTCPEVTP